MSKTLEWLKENIHKDFDPYQNAEDLNTLRAFVVSQPLFRNFCHQISKDFEEAELVSGSRTFYKARFKSKKYSAEGLPEMEERFLSETPVADVLMDFLIAIRRNNQFRADVINKVQ